MNHKIGDPIANPEQYDPTLLSVLSRQDRRASLGISDELPFNGYDIWNAYEVSCLNIRGKPLIAIGEFYWPCQSTTIVESRSFKSYLQSLNQYKLSSLNQLQRILAKDLSEVTSSDVKVKLIEPQHFNKIKLSNPQGTCIDTLDVRICDYQVNPKLLQTKKETASELLYSNLLRCTSPLTAQPDWATISIQYSGPKILHESLLKYLISFYNCEKFHEESVEHIFIDLLTRCGCETLTISAMYTRRGGLDINPIRTNMNISPKNIRHYRQ